MNICVLSAKVEFFFNFAEARHMRINRTNMQAYDGEKVYIYCNRKDRMYGIEFKEIIELGAVDRELRNFARVMCR